MIKIIAIAAIVLVVAVLVLAATKPDSFRFERTKRIKAAPDAIFALINDFHRWSAWSPYEKLDPNMKRKYSGAPSGPGAAYEWEGNSKAGTGRIEITDALQPTKVDMKLDMLKPFEGHNIVEFTLKSVGDSTEVTWAMNGTNSYISKLMGIFFDMDRMVGGQFEEGLANLKSVVEKS